MLPGINPKPWILSLPFISEVWGPYKGYELNSLTMVRDCYVVGAAASLNSLSLHPRDNVWNALSPKDVCRAFGIPTAAFNRGPTEGFQVGFDLFASGATFRVQVLARFRAQG